MSKNDCDTFDDVWQRAPSFMRWWYRIAVVLRVIVLLIFLVEIGIILNDVMTSSPDVGPTPVHHGTALAGTLAAGAG